MQEENPVITFVFDSNEFPTVMNFNVSMNPQISRSLFINHKYEFTSKINSTVFQSFLNFWTTNKFQQNCINADNIAEYEIFNKEMQIKEIDDAIQQKRIEIGDIMINLRTIQNINIRNKSQFEEKIAKNIDDYIVKHGNELLSLPIQSLYNIFNNRNQNLKQHNLLYQLIRNNYKKYNNSSILILLKSIDFNQLTQENQIESIILAENNTEITPNVDVISILKKNYEQKIENQRLKEINDLLLLNQGYNEPYLDEENKAKIQNAITKKDINGLRRLILQRFELENGLMVYLNPINYTAIVTFSSNAHGDIIIPKNFVFQSHEYTITSIESYVFGYFSAIQQITIPESVSKLEDGWFSGMKEKPIVFISRLNKNYKCVDDKYILGKMNEESDAFDVLCYAQNDITEITIPDNIKKISPFCFLNCELLQNVIISKNSQLIEIGKDSFANTFITSIYIPKHISSIEQYTFKNCKKLIEIKFPSDSKLSIIGSYSFSETSIEKIIIPSQVKIINDRAFQHCRNLKEIEFSPNSQLHSIGKEAFDDCPIKSLSIPDSVSRLEEGWCIGIHPETKIIISDSNKNYKCVDDQYIVGKTNEESDDFDVLCHVKRDIKEITIPDNIKRISSYCFYRCYSLQQVNISKNSQLIEIGKESFCYTYIKSIYIPEQVLIIDDSAFYFCKNLKTIEFSSNSKLSIIEDRAFSESSIEKIIIPSQVKIINDYAFYSCEYLEEIEFSPNSQLHSIGNHAFSDCWIEVLTIPGSVSKFNQIADNIYLSEFYIKTKVLVSESNKNYKSVDDKLILGKMNNESDDFDILCFVQKDVTEITIPDNIKKISPNLFDGIELLQQIHLSKNSQLIEIGKNSFYRASIRSICLSKEITIIDDYAFANSKLQYIEIPSDSKLRIIGYNAFEGTSIEQIFIPSQVIKIDSYAFDGCNKLRKINIKSDSKLRLIGSYAFQNTLIESIYIPSRVNKIDENAFYGCKNLTKIDISPDNELRVIGFNIFAESPLKEIKTVEQLKDFKF